MFLVENRELVKRTSPSGHFIDFGYHPSPIVERLINLGLTHNALLYHKLPSLCHSFVPQISSLCNHLFCTTNFPVCATRKLCFPRNLIEQNRLQSKLRKSWNREIRPAPKTYFPQRKFLSKEVCRVVEQCGMRKRSEMLLNFLDLTNQGPHDDLREKRHVPRLSFQSQQSFD